MSPIARCQFVCLSVATLLGSSFARAETPLVAEWQPLFDGKTLSGWKITDFAGHGDAIVEDARIVLPQGEVLTGINCTRDLPTTNYEVSLEAMRVAGSDFFCGLTFPFGETNATLVLGGWGGSTVGLSSINGDDASENETKQIHRFETGRWYRVRLRVTAEKIEAWLDDEQILNLRTQGKAIAMRAGEIEMSLPFGIASFRTRAAFREIKLRRL